MQRPLGLAQFLAQFLIRRRVAVVALHGAQELRQLLVSLLIQGAVLLQAVFGALLELVQGPGPGHPDNGQIKAFIPDQPLQRWKYLLEGQVAGGPEKDQRIRRWGSHQPPPVKRRRRVQATGAAAGPASAF